jgi:F-type H+-transporting ATPase subunit a
VKGFKTISLVGALFVAVLAADVIAQSALTPVTGLPAQSAVAAASAVPAPAETEAPLVPEIAQTLFTVLGFPVTNSMVCTWIVAVIILVIVRVATWKKIRMVPVGMQNALEALVESWESLMGDILDQRVARWVFPFATTFFIFIVLSNFVDLIPGVGSIGFGTHAPNSSLPFAIDHVEKPFFRPPTTDANLTVAMAGIFLVMSLYWAVRYNGFLGLIKHIFGVKVKTNKWVFPVLLLLFIFIGLMDLLSITFARPAALAMRLYGNIFAGETILDMTTHVRPMVGAIALSVLAYCYETFICLVQAFVFGMLTVAFVGTMCEQPDEQHGH